MGNNETSHDTNRETQYGPANNPNEPVPLPPDDRPVHAPIEEPEPDPPPAGDPKTNEPTRLV